MVNFKLSLTDESVLEDITQTIFKLSENEDLSNPILEITQDKNSVLNILELTADIEVTTGVTYYAVASYITPTGGLSFTSNVMSLVGGSTLDIELDLYLPSVTPVPILRSVYPDTSFPDKGFTITMDVVPSVLNRHFATTWILVKLIDNVILDSSIEDGDNIHKKRFTQDLLPGVYEVRAKKHMVSGNDSVYGIFTFTILSKANIFNTHKLAIDVTNTVYDKTELDKVAILSETDDLHMKIFSNDLLVDEMDIDSGLTDVSIYTNAVVQVYINGKEESSLYLYSLAKYPGSCRFMYTLPIDFC